MPSCFVSIALQIPLYNTYDYIWPFEVEPTIGGRVLVPFGRQKKVGIILESKISSDIPTHKLKPVIDRFDDSSILDEHIFELLKFASRYYQYPLGEVIFHALPTRLREGHPLIEPKETYRCLWHVNSSIEPSEILLPKRAKKQIELYQLLIDTPSTSNELKAIGYSDSIIKSLSDKELIQEVKLDIQTEESIPANWQDSYEQPNNALILNREQATAVGIISTHIDTFNTWLIEGVTGSGKTEVYLHLIDIALQAGKQVLVLIPEIGLTPQTISRFQARFKVPMAVLHSKLNDKARLKAWNEAKTDACAIVIGTRSSIFTPFKNLGLIIIDEEHDTSYKQQEGFRYHARDLAIIRAKTLNIPIILGTATPSLESTYNAKIGKFQLIQLTHRAGNALLPKQHIIDLKNQPLESGLSHQLMHVMRTHLAANNQVLLFLNKRGYAPALLCHECGWIAECKHCEKYYTLHQAIKKLRCHHCDHQKTMPIQCEKCGSTQLMPAGIGTEQLAEKLAELFPGVPISRIDRDTVGRKGQLEEELDIIYQGGRRIIVGTQMLAKGHHFADVTLVALLDVDGALFSADFRSAEHFGQLYTQVAGRAGRASKPGEVYLQTHHPEHPWLMTLFQSGYAGLSDMLLKEREMTMLPPYAHHACLRAESIQSQHANQFLISIRNQLRLHPNFDANLWVLGPVPALMAKKSGRYRWQLLFQHTSRQDLHRQLTLIFSLIQADVNLSKIRWILDIDPLET
ncbi:primosomal protein N' [Thorsellia anophelis]|uniref:Replication restart protein PriA n=1 Tax=Thorsellia anophelis DSM 18579 TaxID=1123402 RepID=A0A1I0DS89_9GAMM|nr:primosomal protein N' [Thorsellia anophelis]SET35309.1 replication restart DNA helicase PriA [Thorsellia anophelis DSM 18579]